MIINVCGVIDDALIMKFFVFCSERDFVWNAVVVDPNLMKLMNGPEYNSPRLPIGQKLNDKRFTASIIIFQCLLLITIKIQRILKIKSFESFRPEVGLKRRL